MASTAIFFHYFENNEVYKENLVFFLSVAYRKDLDFFVIISGLCTVSLPELENVTYMYAENKNNDFGGYIYALEKMNKAIDSYKYFIFINSSVRGPFLPKNYDRCWADYFCDLMNSETHLVGSSINILPDTSSYAQKFKDNFGYTQPYSHIQTTAYALSLTALKYLIGIGFYDIHQRLSKEEVISRYELRLSQEVKRAGWNIKSFLTKYNEIDYRGSHSDINYTSVNGDPLFRGAYFGSTAQPSELVFVKTNRNLISAPKLYWYTWIKLLSVSDKKIKNWSEYKKLKIVTFVKFFCYPIFLLRKFHQRLRLNT